ncbi:MAG TPA: PAS domain-containing sensor histidine kinase [Candidatus Saccharimonadales bacterium]|nr:PAS domain-containing sensor histidine kinase [Candidatus Saccharimonadales bacterium]
MRPIAKSLKNITSRTSRARREQAQTFAIFNAIGDGAILTDINGRVERINQVALDLLGFRESEVVGRWYPQIVIAEDAAGRELSPLERPITKAFITGKPISETFFYRTKSGKRMPVAITVSPVLIDAKPVGAISIIRDNTYEFQVDKMKSEFISIASHQLRTPLSAIKTYAHMLETNLGGQLTKQQDQYVSTILDATHRMNILIDALLNTSRLELGKIKVKKQKVVLESLITEMIKEIKQISNGRDISIQFKKPDHPCYANTDALLIKEVVSNLLTNAVKYTPDKGKITVTLLCHKNHIQISVADTGYGIPEGAQARIFSKFFRAANAQVVDAGGTGLGLYTVEQIVTRLGGKVWFTSREDKGTTFYVKLPLKILEQAKS